MTQVWEIPQAKPREYEALRVRLVDDGMGKIHARGPQRNQLSPP